jgi:outer membrane protein OmpA-like peptidoglycan-associated protein
MSASPPPPATVEETYRNRLAERFKPQPGGEQKMATAMPEPPKFQPPANAAMPVINDPLATVVISSDGVVAQGSQSGRERPTYVTASEDARTDSRAAMAGAGADYQAGAGTTRLATILFANGSDRVSGQDLAILRKVSDILKNRGGRLRIVGHASSRTRNMDLIKHKMVNFQISAARADAVAEALVRIGVAPELISVVARSDADPVFYEIMPSGEAGNRRAEIYLDS